MGFEAKGGRWWTEEESLKLKRHMRPLEAMPLTYVGIQRRWYMSMANIPVLVDPRTEITEQGPCDDVGGLGGFYEAAAHEEVDVVPEERAA